MTHFNNINKFKKIIKKKCVDSCLFLDKSNIKYFIDFFIEGMVLLINKNANAVIFIDSMNYDLIFDKFNKLDIDIIVAKNSPILNVVVKYLLDKNIKFLAFNSEKMLVNVFNRLKQLLPKVEIISKIDDVLVSDVLYNLRIVKNNKEIDVLHKVAKKTIKLWKQIKKEILLGMTEKDICILVDSAISCLGCKNSFSTICAIAENTAYPHSIPTNRTLKEHEHVLLDFGMIFQGYCSDLTRVLVKGRINKQLKTFDTFVKKVHDFFVENVKSGIQISSFVKRCEKIFVDNNLSEYILHGLGHGVGIDIHEKPFVSKSNPEYFKENMIVTIEPGLYKNGLGGIRHENMVLIKKKGCEILTL